MMTLVTLPTTEWPAPDRRRWEEAMKPATLLDEIGPAQSWRTQTKCTVEKSYGQSLAWLKHVDRLVENVEPASRWSRETLRDYLSFLRADRRAKTVLHRILNLERALAIVDPRSDRSRLRAIVRNLPEGVNKEGKRLRLQETAALVELGHTLMAKAEAGQHTSIRKNAAVYRDGLQIALLASRPLRLHNFWALELGASLICRCGQWHIVCTNEDVKNHRSIDMPFPDDLIVSLDCYLDKWRPSLCNQVYLGDRLWVSYQKRVQSKTSINQNICRRTEAEFGRGLCPQLFRDCVATSLAVHEPEIVRTASTILGNAPATCEKYYNQASSLEAGRALSGAIEVYRSKSQN